MQNEKCIKCDKLGVVCSGPNFFLMTSAEVVEWCKERKKHLRMTRDKLKDFCGVPMGTLNRFFTGKNNYFYFETARPILRVLAGGAWAADNCLSNQCQIQDVPDTESVAKIEALERENEVLKRENEDLKALILSAISGKLQNG